MISMGTETLVCAFVCAHALVLTEVCLHGRLQSLAQRMSEDDPAYDRSFMLIFLLLSNPIY
jgi:hypothetical protein